MQASLGECFNFKDGFHCNKLAFKLKRQYLNDYKLYHHDRHTVGNVFSLRIQSRTVQRKTFSILLTIILIVKGHLKVKDFLSL